MKQELEADELVFINGGNCATVGGEIAAAEAWFQSNGPDHPSYIWQQVYLQSLYDYQAYCNSLGGPMPGTPCFEWNPFEGCWSGW